MVNGRSVNEGQLEIFLDGGWGTVCGISWGLQEATVACREMGFPNATAVNLGKLLRNETATILKYDVVCTGLENDLQSCRRVETEIDVCTDEFDVGLVCAPKGKFLLLQLETAVYI